MISGYSHKKPTSNIDRHGMPIYSPPLSLADDDDNHNKATLYVNNSATKLTDPTITLKYHKV